MTGIIYKITNLINNKVYIGQTTLSLRLRWQGHCLSINNGNYQMVIKRAIKKYGKENFLVEQIEECSLEDLNTREKYWIHYYNSFYDGYNSTLGGLDYTKMPKLMYKSLEIIDLYNDGFSLREIGREYNVDHATIKLLLIRNNIPLRSKRQYRFTSLEKQLMLNLYNSGIKRKDIIKQFNVSKSYLSLLINGVYKI